MSSNQLQEPSPTLFGHPPGLFALFFAEMWERFSYYGMRALLLFYMIKGFLGYGDSDAYSIYGAYTALVYMTPFFGGMLADRLLGARRAVILGGLLMAAGHLMMAVETELAFFTALGLLICGNGFFKPNISTIVASLYPQGSPKRESGFTIFYMGINLGAAMSPLLCGYIGETYGWHYGFGLATIGMLMGVAVFANWLPPGKSGAPPNPERLRHRPAFITQFLIMAAASTAAVSLFVFHVDNPYAIAVNVLVGVMLLAAGVIACVALRKEVGGLITNEWSIYLGTLLLIPVVVLIVSGFSPLTQDKRPVTLVPESIITGLSADESAYTRLRNLKKAVKAKSEGRVDRFAVRIQQLQDKNAWQDRQYGALEKVVSAAKAAEWTKAQTVFNLIEVGPLMGAQLKELQTANEAEADYLANDEATRHLLEKFKAAVWSKDKDAIDGLAEGLKRLQQRNDLRDKQYTALTEAAQLAKDQQWEESRAKIDESRTLFPRGRMKNIFAVFLKEMSKPAGLILLLAGLVAFGYLGIQTFSLDKIPRERMFVVLILTFFSMLFWAFFEQAGSSVNNFTDRNVDRVFEQKQITEKQVGKTVKIQPTQEQLGYHNGDELFTLNVLDTLREEHKKKKEKLDFTIEWTIAKDNVGMGIAKRSQEMPASIFQSVNPIYIVIFGLAFTALWTVLSRCNLEPSTPVKFALGLAQLGCGYASFWYGAVNADERGMVALGWLFLAYLFQTTGELCLSPVGLSMVSKLSPARLISTVMGGWFLATAFSQLLAGIIAQFTGVVEEGNGGVSVIPVPRETVNVYGDVFGVIAVSAIASALICFALAPLLSRWMHPEVDDGDGTELAEE